MPSASIPQAGPPLRNVTLVTRFTSRRTLAISLATRGRIRMVLVPVCFGTGSYGFMQSYRDETDRARLDQWLRSFAWQSRQPPLICKKLNPR